LEKWLIWCDLNAEQDALEKLFEGRCVSIRGSTPGPKRLELEKAWREGDVPIMISKPLVFGFGMNWQHCSNMVFVGLSDSFEQVFQAIRRCYRFGQTRPVNVHMVTSSLEGAVSENIRRKEADFRKMVAEMVQYTKEITSESVRSADRDVTEYEPQIPIIIPPWLRSESVAS
jgi:SNF2 family DNA or RNA helicase